MNLRKRRFDLDRLPRLAIVTAALLGAWVSGTLLYEHDGGYSAGAEAGGFLTSLCHSTAVPSARCAEVVGSRWGSFDVVLGSRVLVFPTSLLGVSYFLTVAAWFLLANPIVEGVSWFRRLTWVLIAVGFAGSLWFTGAMLFSLSHWCPLCMVAHGLNGTILLAAWWQNRNHRSGSAKSDPRDADPLGLVGCYHKKLARAALTLGALVPVLCWGYYDAASASRRQWRKHLACRETIALLQNDPALMLREFLAQPVLAIPPREAHAHTGQLRTEPFGARLVVFTDEACAACRCFERQRPELVERAFQGELKVEHWRYSKNGDASEVDQRMAEALGVNSTPAVFLNGRRVPDLCLGSVVFWNAVAEELRRSQVAAAPTHPNSTHSEVGQDE